MAHSEHETTALLLLSPAGDLRAYLATRCVLLLDSHEVSFCQSLCIAFDPNGVTDELETLAALIPIANSAATTLRINVLAGRHLRICFLVAVDCGRLLLAPLPTSAARPRMFYSCPCHRRGHKCIKRRADILTVTRPKHVCITLCCLLHPSVSCTLT